MQKGLLYPKRSQVDKRDDNLEDHQASGRLSMRAMIERKVPEERQKIKRRKRKAERERRLQEISSDDTPRINERNQLADFKRCKIEDKETIIDVGTEQNTLNLTAE